MKDMPKKYTTDPMFKTGTLHYTKLKNARVIVNVPEDIDGVAKVLFKFIRYSKDFEDYNVNNNVLLGHCKRGVATTYLILSTEAYAAITHTGLKLISENFDHFYKFGYGAGVK